MSTSETTSSSRPIGKSSVVAGVLVILLSAGAGWWAFSQSVPRPMNSSDFRADPGARGGRWNFGAGNTRNTARVNVPARPREPVSVLPRVVTIRDGDMTISSSMRSDANWNVAVSFNGESLGGTESQRLLIAVRRIMQTRRPPANLNLTDAQKAALEAVPLTPPELSEAQLAELTSLMTRAQNALGKDAELTPIKAQLQKLAASVKSVDRAGVKTKYDARDAKLRSILTAEQLETLVNGANNRNNRTNPVAPGIPKTDGAPNTPV